MKAIVQNTYGSADVLQLRDIAAPVPGRGEVLVRAVCGPAKADLARSIGADHVIDYTRTEIGAGHASGKGVITV